MNKAQRIAVGLAVVLLIAALPVFSGGQQEAGPRQAAPQAAAGVGKATLRIAYPTGGEMPVNAMKESFRQFSAKYPGVDFEELTAPMVDFENVVLKTILAKGDIPDLYYLTGGSWQLRKYVEAGDYAVDLTGYLFPHYGGLTQGDWGYDFIPSFLDVNRIHGKYYMIPFVATSEWMWFNKNVFARYGWKDAPPTWGDMLKKAAALKNDGVLPLSLGDKERYPAGNWACLLSQRVAGDATFAGVFGRREGNSFTHPDMVKTMGLIAELVAKGYVNQGSVGMSADTATMLLYQNKAAMMPKGSWMVVLTKDQGPANFEYGVFPVPEVEGGKGYRDFIMGAANGFCVGKTDNAELAVEFQKFFTSKDTQLKMMQEAGIFPVLKGVLTPQTVAHPSQLEIEQLILQAKGSSGWVDDGWGYDVADAFETAVETVLQGGDAGKAMQAAALAVSKITRAPQ
jgi:raffinose/stachyose/melibiose transport system substrate-binding protein